MNKKLYDFDFKFNFMNKTFDFFAKIQFFGILGILTNFYVNQNMHFYRFKNSDRCHKSRFFKVSVKFVKKYFFYAN